MGAAISCKNLVSSSSSARTCFAQCLALFNSLVVLPGAEVVPAPGAVVVSGGVIVLLAFGTAIELFFGSTGKVIYAFYKSNIFLYHFLLPFKVLHK